MKIKRVFKCGLTGTDCVIILDAEGQELCLDVADYNVLVENMQDRLDRAEAVVDEASWIGDAVTDLPTEALVDIVAEQIDEARFVVAGMFTSGCNDDEDIQEWKTTKLKD